VALEVLGAVAAYAAVGYATEIWPILCTSCT